MEFALVDGVRASPQPKLKGACEFCARTTIAKCGPKIMWHWSHAGKKHCDPWGKTKLNGTGNGNPIFQQSGENNVDSMMTAMSGILPIYESFIKFPQQTDMQNRDSRHHAKRNWRGCTINAGVREMVW